MAVAWKTRPRKISAERSVSRETVCLFIFVLVFSCRFFLFKVSAEKQASFTVPQKGVRRGGSDQQITQKPLLSHLEVTILLDPPWGGRCVVVSSRGARFSGCDPRLEDPLPWVAVRCDMVLHQAFRARRVRKTGIGGEVRHAVASGVSCETSLNKYVTPHLHREYRGWRHRRLQKKTPPEEKTRGKRGGVEFSDP